MTAKTAMIRARTTPDIKATAEKVFEALGLTATDAINMFYHQVAMSRGIPFQVKITNKETLAAIEEGDAMLKDKNRKFKTKEQVYKELNL